nr:delta-endotoxin=70 kda coleoptera-specific crystal protein {N-terminal} [Bacillus thuringiensis, YM-03, Peptide Partial, 19 aa] [Bacillus thuringiensis]
GLALELFQNDNAVPGLELG